MSSPRSTPPSPAPAPAAAGRVNQKRRTRRALLEAAMSLYEQGVDPTFGQVAERAMVSRATAYRYFSSVEALISEAIFERSVPRATSAMRAAW